VIDLMEALRASLEKSPRSALQPQSRETLAQGRRQK